ncbi:hypothetical protein ACIBEH_06230 [Nocardia salmonicida]|uniref:hypothetical protein n=1 Tax=Nocardia salmonicida TaxID=53431 RepID=UPI0037876A0B
MTTVTISYTAEQGTLLEGTIRGDGTYEVMAAVRSAVGHWRCARSLGCWIVVSSRDRQPKQYLIDYATGKLRDAGYTVELSIDRTRGRPPTPRPTVPPDRAIESTHCRTKRLARTRKPSPQTRPTSGPHWWSIGIRTVRYSVADTFRSTGEGNDRMAARERIIDPAARDATLSCVHSGGLKNRSEESVARVLRHTDFHRNSIAIG